jgi:hypothetical protein
MRKMKAYAASEGPPSVRERGIPQWVLDEEEEALGDLLDPWRDRNRHDRYVLGAIKAAWYRGRRKAEEDLAKVGHTS